MASLRISRRAVRDLEEIRNFSVEHWGNRVAEEYLDHIEEALQRLRQNPTLLRIRPEFSRHFRFFRVSRHYLVCFVVEDSTYLVTVKHGSLDLPSHLADLEPTLLEETDLLHKALLVKLKRRPARPASKL